MPTIVFASSKGGTGKTTAATVLAAELARQGSGEGLSVTLIDSDPNQHSAKWGAKNGCPDNIFLLPGVNEETMLDAIERGEGQSPFVLVDLEGTASMAVTSAISRADLVITVCQGSRDDVDEAVKTIKLIKNQARVLARDIPYSVLMTRTSAAIMPRTLRNFINQFNEAGVDLFTCSLVERDAFKAMRDFGGSVNDLPPREVSLKSIESASANAKALAEEVKHKLKAILEQRRLAHAG